MAILSSGLVKMTSLLEKLVSVIAPQRCIICGNYNNVVCTACVYSLHRFEVPACALCGGVSARWQLCGICAPQSALRGVWMAAPYEGAVAELIKTYKFGHARSACQPISTLIAATLPYLPEDWLVVPVPTVAARVRQRGFDHVRLIAREVARQKKIRMVAVLTRQQDVRQVGASRQQRQEQARHTFAVALRALPTGAKIMLVDDVCTTGATLSAAAAVLKKAGAAEVWGAVAAWQAPKNTKKKDR